MKIPRHLQLIAASALLFLSLAGIAHFLSPEKPKPITDLATAEGKIVSYSFLDDSRGAHKYTINLSGYPATFEIPADFAQYFALARFESNLKKGDYLSVSISPDSAGSLAAGRPVPIFAARTKTATYLDEYYTVRAFNAQNNSSSNNFAAGLSIVFLFIGVALIIALAALAYTGWRAQTVPEPDPSIKESSERLEKCLALGDPQEKANHPACPLCGSPAEFGALFGTEPATLHWIAGRLKKGIATNIKESDALGTRGLLSGRYAEGLRCSVCKRIIVEYKIPVGKVPQPMPGGALPQSSHATPAVAAPGP